MSNFTSRKGKQLSVHINSLHPKCQFGKLQNCACRGDHFTLNLRQWKTQSEIEFKRHLGNFGVRVRTSITCRGNYFFEIDLWVFPSKSQYWRFSTKVLERCRKFWPKTEIGQDDRHLNANRPLGTFLTGLGSAADAISELVSSSMSSLWARNRCLPRLHGSQW